MIRLALGVLVGVLVSSSSADAQIVNVLPQLAMSAEDGFSGSLTTSVSWKTGNVKFFEAKGQAAVAYRDGDNTVYLVGRNRYTCREECKGDEVLISQTFEHLRYRRTLLPRLAGEAFVQHELDRKRRLRLRALIGAGVRLSLLTTEALELTWGTAYMAGHELLKKDWKDPPNTTHRWSNYLEATAHLQEAWSVQTTVFVQPRFDDFEDVRVMGEAALVVQASDWLGLKISFNVIYDSRPPSRPPENDTPGVSLDKRDTTLETSLVFTL